jgi:uncharacterized SAM-binding protein YcdF (DUF218 family)
VSEARLVAVLGHSSWWHDGLHAVSAARLARAAELSTEQDAVLLTGWSRRRRRASEAELMAGAWSGSAREVLLDAGARTTSGNARAVARAARRLGATEIVVVTSGWHGRRASTLVRAAVRDLGPEVRLAPTDESGRRRDRMRELACWTLVPLQSARASRRR